MPIRKHRSHLRVLSIRALFPGVSPFFENYNHSTCGLLLIILYWSSRALIYDGDVVKKKGFWTLTILASTGIFSCAVGQLRAQEPEILSLFPAGARQGTTLTVEVRGRDLEGAALGWFACADLQASVQKVEEIILEKDETSPIYIANALEDKVGHPISELI